MFGSAMQELICSICSMELNTKDRQPHLLPSTGHTVCLICVQNIVMDTNSNISLEDELKSLRLSKQDLQLNDFPLNQALIRLLQFGGQKTKSTKIEQLKTEEQPMHKILSDLDGDQPDALTTSFDEPVSRNLTNNYLDDVSDSSKRKKPKSTSRQPSKRQPFATQSKNDLNGPQQRQCMIHKRNIEVVCLDCKDMICTNCALFGQHKGHTIYSEEDLMMMLTEKAQDIYEKAELIQKQSNTLQRETFDMRFRENINEMANNIQNKIRCEFNNLKVLLEEHENKALNFVLEQVLQKTQLWDSWWESNTLSLNSIQRSKDWCFQARQIIEALADIKGGGNPYWDLLSWSDGIKSKGITIQRDLQNVIQAVEVQLNEAGKCPLQVQFNTLPVSMAIEDYCRMVKQSSIQQQTFIKRLQSPLQTNINRHYFPAIPHHHNEDSDLLSNAEDLGKSMVHETQDLKQSQYSMLSEAHIEPLHPHNQSYVAKSSNHMKFSSVLNASQLRNQRSITPNYVQDAELSLSPVPIQGKVTQRQKKKSSAASQLPHKLQILLDNLRNGTFSDTIVDFQGQEMNLELATYLGTEAKQWKVKTLKMMKCKLTDDHMYAFFLALGGFNDSIQSINLAQNNLTDRTVDHLKDIMAQDFWNKNLKNIILSQNKLNARKCQSKILELKRLGLTITL